MIRFLIILSLTALVLSGLMLLLFAPLPSFFYEILGVLFLGTVGVHYLTLRLQRASHTRFATFYTVIPLAKLVIYGGYALFIVWHDADQAGRNMATFIGIYLLFTALELYFSYYRKGE